MLILTISGSARPSSSNLRLLMALAVLAPEHEFQHYDKLDQLPLFTAPQDQAPWIDTVLQWRQAVQAADALIICTPEYIHNMPALLKNALEWLTSSGDLYRKPVLPITFTPLPPRGEKAMQSLLWSLKALEARILGQVDLYQSEVSFGDDGSLSDANSIELCQLALQQLSSMD